MSETRFPWRTLLFLSLALNLLVVGAIGGALASGARLQRAAQEQNVGQMVGARAFLAALPPETREKVRLELVDAWTESRDLRRAALEARRDSLQTASQEPFDVEQVRSAFARQRAADQAAIAIFHDNVVDAFATLTPEERREALEALREAAPPARAGQQSLEERRQMRRERRRQRLEERRNQP